MRDESAGQKCTPREELREGGVGWERPPLRWAGCPSGPCKLTFLLHPAVSVEQHEIIFWVMAWY